MYAGLTQICTVPITGGGSTSLAYTLDSATKKCAISFQPSESFTLAKVAFKVVSKTGSPTCSIRIETDDGSGRPSGTLAWTNATITGVAISATGWQSEQSLTASGTVSPGTIYHVVIANDAATPASNYFDFNDQVITSQITSGYGCPQYLTSVTASYNGSAWANRAGPIFMLSDSGGTTKVGQPFDNTGFQTMSNTTAYGVKFTAPLSGSVAGVTLSSLPNTGIGDVTAKLYDNSDTLLGTATFKTGLNTLLSGRVLRWFPFDSGAVSITSGSTYRVVFNDSGSADRMEYATAPSSPDYTQIAPFAQAMQWTQGTTGSWTDTPGKLPLLFSLTVSSVSAGGNTTTIIKRPRRVM